MTTSSEEFAIKKSTIWFVIGGLLFVLGWRILVIAIHYFNEPAIVRELGSILQFEQDVLPNHTNTRLVFCQDTEEGVGIYFCDTTGGKPRLLCEQKEKGRSWKRFTMLGWAPDDSLFACAFPDNIQDKELILIFNGSTGAPLGKVVADQNLYQLAWLSTSSLAYCTRTDIRTIARQPDGSWTRARNLLQIATNLDDFAAVSANYVAWRDGGALWLCNLASGAPERIWEATTNRLVEFTYAKAADEFLLNCSDEAGQYLLRFRPSDKRTINLGQISGQQDYIRNASWGSHGSGYAYLTNDSAGSAFCVKTGGSTTVTVIPWHGGVRSFTLSGGELFFSGNADDQAPGIWSYDLKSETFKCIVSSTSGPLKHSVGRPSSCEVMTNSLGEQRFYHLWTPPQVAPDQRHPVLLAQELNTWFPYFQIAAHSGCYVAVVDRPFFHTWDGDHERTWVEDVSSLYEIMARLPNVDTNRVYLYACSAETSYLSPLLDTRPTLAKGAILFSPSALPDPAVLQNKRLLLVDGKADGDAAKRLSEFQDRAAGDGTAVSLYLQDAAGHMPASGVTERNRATQFAKFLADH